MCKWVIVIGSVDELNCAVGVFNTEEEAQAQLETLEANWWGNGERYSGAILPLNSLDSRTVRVADDGSLFLGDPND